MNRFFVVTLAAMMLGGCTLDLDDLKGLITITSGGEEEGTCLEQFEACVAAGDDVDVCVVALTECRTSTEPEPEPTDRCYEQYEACIGVDGRDWDADGVDGACEELLRECLEGSDPVDPDPTEMCYREYEACIDGAFGDDGRDPSGVGGEDSWMHCEEMLRECLGSTGPVDPDPTETCYREYEACIDGAFGDESGEPTFEGECEEMLRQCLEGTHPIEPNPEEECYRRHEMCLMEDGAPDESFWAHCDEELRACLEAIGLVDPPVSDCDRSFEECLMNGEAPDVCEEIFRDCSGDPVDPPGIDPEGCWVEFERCVETGAADEDCEAILRDCDAAR